MQWNSASNFILVIAFPLICLQKWNNPPLLSNKFIHEKIVFLFIGKPKKRLTSQEKDDLIKKLTKKVAYQRSELRKCREKLKINPETACLGYLQSVLKPKTYEL